METIQLARKDNFMGVEIERKFLIKGIPDNIEKYDYHEIEQAYLTTNPVIRVRKSDDEYYMTYKGKGFISREEYNLPLTKEAYDTLKSKADGKIISKKRVLIPYQKYMIELDIFKGDYEGLVFAEVEFDSEEEAKAFEKPDWFLEDVTEDRRYSNSYLSRCN